VTDEQLKAAFLDWWKDSFPMAPPNSRTVESHVAFASHVLSLAELFQEYEGK
jgi:hypothetical protein